MLDVLETCKFLDLFLNDREAWNTTQKSVSGACITAASAFVGALLFGPPGLAIGGTLGGITSYTIYRDDFVSLMNVWNDMPPYKRNQIARQFNAAYQFDVRDAIALIQLLKCDPTSMENVKNYLREYLRSSFQPVPSN